MNEINSDVSISKNEEAVKIDMSDFYLPTRADIDNASLSAKSLGEDIKRCGYEEGLVEALEDDPALEKRLYDIEYNIRKYLSEKQTINVVNRTKALSASGDSKTNKGEKADDIPSNLVHDTIQIDRINDGLGRINVPVYIHVLFKNDKENKAMPKDRIKHQIKVLNDGFETSYDSELPESSTFVEDVAGDTDIRFTLAGITRTSIKKTLSIKKMKSTALGGHDPVNPLKYLNVWVISNVDYLGSATFPGDNRNKEGIVLAYRAFAKKNVEKGAAMGRTLAHEVGHYLGLRHIWGTNGCKNGDYVLDTPKAFKEYYNCPKYPQISCKSIDMTMNYMDYTSDQCMYMFTNGQVNRMRSYFAPGKPKHQMILDGGEPYGEASSDSYKIFQNNLARLKVLNNDYLIGEYGEDYTSRIKRSPVNGIAVLKTDGSISYRPNFNFIGIDSLRYEVTIFKKEGSNTIQRTEKANVYIHVLASNKKNNITYANTPIVLDIFDENYFKDYYSSFSIENIEDPKNGTLIISEDGKATYTPNKDFTGDDKVKYQIEAVLNGKTLVSQERQIIKVNKK